MKPLTCAALLLMLGVPLMAADQKEEGFVPLFNGRDLTGWVRVNCAPSTFYVKDGQIVTTGQPIGFMRTEKQYENFIADFEWMHVNKKTPGNSGFFVWADPLPAVGIPFTRGIEVQVLVNMERDGWYTSHGDLFSIHGATCKPDRPHPQGWARCLPNERRCKGGGEWNHYRVIARDGVLKLHVNGKEVSGLSECRPRKGYLCLESEGAECHFRNLKIKELPSTNPQPDEVAQMSEGFVSLFTGLDLAGWKQDAATREHWKVRDGSLFHADKGIGQLGTLTTSRQYGDVEILVDFQFPRKKEKLAYWTLLLRKDGDRGVKLTLTTRDTLSVTGRGTGGQADSSAKLTDDSGQWRRLRVSLVGGTLRALIDGSSRVETQISGLTPQGPIELQAEKEVELRNLFVRELRR